MSQQIALITTLTYILIYSLLIDILLTYFHLSIVLSSIESIISLLRGMSLIYNVFHWDVDTYLIKIELQILNI